jgi:hypothetical protein
MKLTEVQHGMLNKLVGPNPPKDFESNGCTLSPDGFWFIACHVHDFEYKLAGELMAEARTERTQGNHVEYLRLRSKATHARYTADINLGQNIKLCAFMRYRGWKAVCLYLPISLIARIYRKVTRTWGWLFAY